MDVIERTCDGCARFATDCVTMDDAYLCGDCRAEIAAEEAEVEALRQQLQGAVSALEKYGQHHVGCSGAIHRDGKVLGCACGFANALAAVRGR